MRKDTLKRGSGRDRLFNGEGHPEKRKWKGQKDKYPQGA
jgi:hypothetical protein